VQVLTAAGARGRPDAAAEVATVWRSLVPDPTTRAHVLGEGSAWLERRATAAASEVAGGSSRRAAGRSWTYDAGSGEPRTPDPDLTAVGAELRASCDAGPFVQLCCRAVHVHKVRLLPLAGHEDVAAELRAEASLWRAIADA
jgi:hypothetical protein